MKAICFRGTEQVSVETVPDPVILAQTDAIVQVELAGLCGSDLHLYHGREQGADVGTVMGHEFVGRIAAIGNQVRALRVGQRVCAPFTTNCGKCFYCQSGLTSRCAVGELFGWRTNRRGLHGGQAALVRVPFADATLVSVPETVSDELALLWGDNLGTAFYCAELAEVSREKTHVIIGCGTVGLLTIFAARNSGAEHVIAFDIDPARLSQAESFGAQAANSERELVEMVNHRSDKRGADAVMELVGLPAAQKLAFQVVRPGGILSVIGCHCTPQFAFSPMQAYDKNLTYRTGRCPARHYMDKLAPLIQGHDFSELASLISHQFSIEQGVEAYDIFANRKDECVKAAIAFA
jgi:2-desacetyl-2-hydroxyethyl bacteriochlorophyllide A dehydrogenase